ncbi:hypothetical protein BDR03DRAFT_968430 [Suillus americanus]|nr:hypothetical protein BDR03DRAFT_968430 [Suillus americanus]
MTRLLCAVLFCVPFVCASLGLSLNDTCIHTLDVSNCPSNNTRTLWNILLSCGLTLFACTWTAIHTNIPGVNEGVVAVTSRRLFIMVVALISPELMITWATRQFFSARQAAKDFNTEFSAHRARTYGNDRDISYRTAIPLSDISRSSSAPRPAHCPGWRTLVSRSVICLAVRQDYNATDVFIEWRTAHGFFGDDRDISEITEASESSESSAPRPAVFRERRMTPGYFGDDRYISDITEASRSSSVLRPAEFQRWRMTHGFFAWMGGFMLYVDGKPRAPLTTDELCYFVRVGSVNMPVISEAEIEDRSKGDGLSKGIALLQLVWFVIQLIARYVQNLPITLLEIDTLAVAALTCVAYGLWWKKPKDVGCPYIVHWKAHSQPSPLTYDTENFHGLVAGCLDRLIYPFTSLMGIGASVSPRAVRFRRVPSLGGYSNYDYATSVRLIGCFSGMVFGAIHCLGWNYLFQKPTEHVLWHAASLGIAGAPILLFLYVEYWIGWEGSDVVQSIIICAAIITSFIYVAARVTLIVLIMLSLQSLPLGAYDTVAWTQFIPHL